MSKYQQPISWNLIQVKQPEPAPTKSGFRPHIRPSGRSFDAADFTLLTTFFRSANGNINTDLEAQLIPLRGRCRTLRDNNEYAKHYLRLVGTNAVGPSGFMVRFSGLNAEGTRDVIGNRIVQAHWWDWQEKQNCDVTGMQSFGAMCRMLAQLVACDGEALVRKVRNRSKYGFQLQVLDIDRLNMRAKGMLKNGSRVRMGVQTNSMGKVEGYHLHAQTLGDFGNVPQKSTDEFVLASDMFHIFKRERAEQLRGIPQMHAALATMYQLGAFDEAALVAARVGASKMGFFTNPDGNGEALAEGEDALGNLTQDLEPGKIGVLPDGYSFENFNPDYPNGNYDPFVKANLRRTSSGLGVAYSALSSDLENVNFSSIRSGVLDEHNQ